jgi:hypothetical protein
MHADLDHLDRGPNRFSSAFATGAGALALLMTLLPAATAAQTMDVTSAEIPTPNPGVVFQLGGGVGSQGGAGLLSVGVPLRRGELVVRAGATTSLEIFGPSESVGDIGVLYGMRRVGSQGWARLAGGFGLVSQEATVARPGPCSNWFGCYDNETTTGVGLLGQADAVWSPFSRFGLGLTLYGGVGAGGGAYGAASVGIYIGRAGLVPGG